MTANSRRSSEVRVGRQGRIVIPADLRATLGFEEGDRLVARIEDGELRLSTIRANIQRARSLIQSRVPEGRDLMAEFYEERRREAASE